MTHIALQPNQHRGRVGTGAARDLLVCNAREQLVGLGGWVDLGQGIAIDGVNGTSNVLRSLDPEQRLLARTRVSAGAADADQSTGHKAEGGKTHQKATSARRVNALFFRSVGIPLASRPC